MCLNSLLKKLSQDACPIQHYEIQLHGTLLHYRLSASLKTLWVSLLQILKHRVRTCSPLANGYQCTGDRINWKWWCTLPMILWAFFHFSTKLSHSYPYLENIPHLLECWVGPLADMLTCLSSLLWGSLSLLQVWFFFWEWLFDGFQPFHSIFSDIQIILWNVANCIWVDNISEIRATRKQCSNLDII